MPDPEEPIPDVSRSGAAERMNTLLRLESILLVVIIVAALKAAESVILPLVFALFLVALFSPLHRWFQRYMRAGLATALTLLILAIVLACLGGILWLSLLSVAERLPAYQQAANRYARMLESYGLAIPGLGSTLQDQLGEGGAIRLEPELLLEVILPLLGLGGLIMLIFSYLVLSLVGFDDYARRVNGILPENQNGQWLRLAQQVSPDFQGYIVVRTLTGLIKGVAIGGATWIIGLEFSFIWGLVTFLFSYIPIFGTIAASLLPILFAVAQFGQWEKVLLPTLVIVGIHAILGNFVSPIIYGQFLKPTPLAILLSVTFWGWLWHIPGAFIGVPLTILLVIIAKQFRQTRWIAALLADVD